MPYLKPYWFWVVLKLIGTIINALNDILLVYFIQQLVNSSLSKDRSELMQSIYLMLAVVGIGIIVNFVEAYSAGRFSAGAVRDMKGQISNHLSNLPVATLDRYHSGDLISRMTNGMNGMESFYKHDFTGIIFHLLRLGVSFAAMLYFNWSLLLFCMVLIPVTVVLSNVVGKPLEGYAAKLQQSLAQTNATVADSLGGIPMVKAYNLAQVLFGRYSGNVKAALQDALAIEKSRAIMSMVSVIINTAPFLLCFLYGGYLVIEGDFTAGGLIAFAQLLNYFVQSAGLAPNLFGNYKVTMGTARQLFEILDETAERTDGSGFSEDQTVPAIDIKDLSFSYDGANQVLHGLTMGVAPGTVTAIVGPSGGGKSSIVKLLCGFYAYQDGSIRLYGKDLSEWSLPAARSMMAVVSQDTYLFPGSIKENLLYGNPDATMKDVIEAAQIANIHDFITELQDGYDTLVGERGAQLSGGQKQRVSIARAILKNSPIILLDEPTSALDTESEALVQEALERIMQGKTVLVIAHRLSTIQMADQVLVLNQGRIVEKGTHQELLEARSFYQRLYLGQFIGEDSTLTLPREEGAS